MKKSKAAAQPDVLPANPELDKLLEKGLFREKLAEANRILEKYPPPVVVEEERAKYGN